MTSIPRQLATFVAVLAVLYAGAALAGQLIDPDERGRDTPGHRSGKGAHTPDPERR